MDNSLQLAREKVKNVLGERFNSIRPQFPKLGLPNIPVFQILNILALKVSKCVSWNTYLKAIKLLIIPYSQVKSFLLEGIMW